MICQVTNYVMAREVANEWKKDGWSDDNTQFAGVVRMAMHGARGWLATAWLTWNRTSDVTAW